MAPGSSFPGCWSECSDYHGTGGPCGIAEAPLDAMPMVAFYASYRDSVSAGKVTLDTLVGLYADTRSDKRELVEAWVMLDTVFAPPAMHREEVG